MRIATVLCMFLAVATMLSSLDAEIAVGQGSAPVSKALRDALLAEDWDEVKRLCGPDDQLTSSPVLRAIKGHACLWLNRNDDSLKLFLSIARTGDQRAWKEWAVEFADDYHDNAVAHYLKADALARANLWKDAIESANEALRLDPKFVLALNAKGIAHAALDEFDAAWSDFDRACKLASSFADARANLGTLLYRKRAIKGAIREYKEALRICEEIDVEFSLARNGLACCYFLRGEKDEDKDDWEKAAEILGGLTKKPAIGFLSLNNLNSIVAEELRLAKEIAAKGGPGSALDVGRRIGQLERHERNIGIGMAISQFDPFGWTDRWRDNMIRNRESHSAEIAQLRQSIGETGMGNPGGVKTKEIEDAFKRNIKGRKELPVTTWFGLAQDVSF